MNGVIRNGLLQRLPIAALAVALALAAALACDSSGNMPPRLPPRAPLPIDEAAARGGGPPVGREAFRHDFGGEIYVFVEYGDELAIFSASGQPVSAKRDADAALRSYAWTRALDAADVSGLAKAADSASEVDSYIANARRATDAVAEVLDELDGIGASIPFRGRVSAMDLVESAYPGVGALGGAMRDLDSTLNDWGADSENLSDAAASVQTLSHSQRPDADAVESAFESADSAARGLANTIGEIESSLDNARDNVSRLERALRSASNTPLIGGAIESLANEIGGAVDDALSGLDARLGGLKGDLSAVSTGFGAGAAQAETDFRDYAGRWMGNPPDASWPPTDPERISPPRPDPTPRPFAGGESTSMPVAAAPTATAAQAPTSPAAAESSGGAGGRIAFSSGKDGDFEIYAMNPDGSGVARVVAAGRLG